MFLVFGLALLTGKCHAVGTGYGLKREYVGLAENRDTSLDSGGCCVPHTDLMGDLARDAVCRRVGPQAGGLTHLRVVHDLKEGRLFKLDSESLPQSVVENRIAGVVDEGGEHQHIFIGEWSGARMLGPPDGRGQAQHSRCRNADLPPMSTPAVYS